MKGMRLISLAAVLVLSALASQAAGAQSFAVSVNAGDAAALGTVGVGASYAVARNWTVDASGRWNPWTFRKAAGGQWQYRHQTYSVGARWWPWYAFSGWYVSGMAQYQEYSRGGLVREQTEEGDAAGFAFGFGYMHMLSARWNFSVGATGWAGATKYRTYACPHCGRQTGGGTKAFILPNELMLGFTYVF